MAIAIHKITIAGKDYSIKLADNYDNGSSSNIGSVLGIEKLGANDTLPPGTIRVSVSTAINSGALGRLVIRHRADNNSPVKTGRIICPIDKLADAVSNLVGKNYRGGTVISAGVPQRVRYT